MKIVFHERFYEEYASDPAAADGRMEAIVKALGGDFEFLTPSPASEKDLTLVHTPDQIERIKRLRHTYEVALLSAGGAILTSQIAWKGEPAFGLIRPPGHHASPDSCWGFCFFNNMAVAVKNTCKPCTLKTRSGIINIRSNGCLRKNNIDQIDIGCHDKKVIPISWGIEHLKKIA